MRTANSIVNVRGIKFIFVMFRGEYKCKVFDAGAADMPELHKLCFGMLFFDITGNWRSSSGRGQNNVGIWGADCIFAFGNQAEQSCSANEVGQCRPTVILQRFFCNGKPGFIKAVGNSFSLMAATNAVIQQYPYVFFHKFNLFVR